jgi:transposase InsO family protein
VQELRHKCSLKELLEISGISRSSYYFLIAEKIDNDAEIKELIGKIYHTHKGRYGYRRITQALRNKGITINHKKVQRLMGILGLKSMVRIKKYKSYRGEVGKVAPNLLNRKFTAAKPNQKWVTDITEFTLFGQKLYLSPILDLYNGEIVSYAIHGRPARSMVKEMLEKVEGLMNANPKIILHSDQGCHYQALWYQEFLTKNKMKQSMSRKGNCLDNAVMENFFGLLKSELLYLQNFDSIGHFIDELHKYILYYNNDRIKTKLKMSPVQYRTHFNIAA